MLMSEDLGTDHVKLESPSIFPKKSFFARPLGGAWAPCLPPLSTPVVQGTRRVGSTGRAPCCVLVAGVGRRGCVGVVRAAGRRGSGSVACRVAQCAQLGAFRFAFTFFLYFRCSFDAF